MNFNKIKEIPDEINKYFIKHSATNPLAALLGAYTSSFIQLDIRTIQQLIKFLNPIPLLNIYEILCQSPFRNLPKPATVRGFPCFDPFNKIN